MKKVTRKAIGAWILLLVRSIVGAISMPSMEGRCREASALLGVCL